MLKSILQSLCFIFPFFKYVLSCLANGDQKKLNSTYETELNFRILFGNNWEIYGTRNWAWCIQLRIA